MNIFSVQNKGYKTMKESAYEELSRVSKTIDEFRKMPIYYSGDDTFVTNLENAEYDDFVKIRNEIALERTDDNVYDHTIAENHFCWVKNVNGYSGAYYVPCRKQIRIIKRLVGELIPDCLTEEKIFEKNKKLIQLCPDDKADNFGMGYILCLGKGHFIIYDGNGDLGGMADKIYGYLIENTPEGQRPVIDAWVVTHIHWDHVAGMFVFVKEHADKVDIRNIVTNIPPHHNLYIKERGMNTDFYARWWPKILAWLPNTKVWKVHTGQAFNVADVKIEILYTQEDLYPATLYPNDTSVVTLMYVNGRKIFFSGDVEYETPCRLIHDMYGSYLKSDFYQASHHGWNSEALFFYDDVDAPNVLWPVRYRFWDTIQQFKSTQRLTEDFEQNKRKFYMTIDTDSTIEL